MGAVVPRYNTPVTAERALVLLHDAFRDAGATLTDDMASLFAAQLWLESGRGTHVYNFNFGNLAATASYDGNRWSAPWQDLAGVEALPDGPTKERYRKLHAEFLAGKEPGFFRAYPSEAPGMADYVALLLRPRFRDLLYASLSGDAARFAAAIQSTGYAPGIDVAATAKTLASLQAEFRPLLRTPMATGAMQGGFAVSLVLAALALWSFVRR